MPNDTCPSSLSHRSIPGWYAVLYSVGRVFVPRTRDMVRHILSQFLVLSGLDFPEDS